jgi:transcriptional regulator with XRE-family HTH domain
MACTAQSTPIVKPFSKAVLRWLGRTIAGLPVAQTKQRQRETFGQRLARLRRAAGLTQLQLADKTGISRRMIAHYETQATAPPTHAIPKLAEAFGVSADEVLGQKPAGPRAAEAPQSTVDLRLWRKLQELQKLPLRKRQAVLQVLDDFLAANADGSS